MENSNPNCILITVGHPASGMDDVLSLLQQLGLSKPLVGKLHGMAAADISTYLLKRAAREVDFLKPVVQIKPTPLWQSLALDLLLANDQQNFWGWVDTQAIYMLDYWHEADPAFYFVLVYDHPAHALVRAFAQQSLDEAALAQFQQSWQHYHTALLHFYTRHQNRCLLVQASEVLAQPASLVEAIRSRMNVALDASTAQLSLAQPDAQQLYVAQAVLQQVQWPSDHEELQAVADVPQADLAPIAPIASWNARVALQQQLGKVQHDLERYQEEKQALQQTQEKLEQQGQAWQKQLEATKKTLAERDAKITELQKQPVNTAQLQELEEENQLLLAQLHQVQEELERYYLENQALKQGQPAEKKAQLPSPSKTYPVAYYGAADRVKQQLTYRLGNTLVQQSRSFKGILTLPSALQQQVRQFKQDQQAKAGQKLPPIERYADAHEAERVRQHLSYRLGKILLENYRTPIGWVKLPFAMRREVKDFRQHRAQSHH